MKDTVPPIHGIMYFPNASFELNRKLENLRNFYFFRRGFLADFLADLDEGGGGVFNIFLSASSNPSPCVVNGGDFDTKKCCHKLRPISRRFIAIDIFGLSATIFLFMATMVTTISTVGTTATHTACRPSFGKLDALLKNSKAMTYTVPNEFISAEIGRFLGLPIPPGGLCYKQGHDPEHFFASLNFNLCNSTLPPVDPSHCANVLAFESTGILMFDILIANGDRHRGNLNIDSSQNPPKLTVFDHSHALFGITNGAGRTRLISLQDKLGITDGNRHCLLDAIRGDAHFREWIDRIKGLPNYLIDGACDATVPLGMITAAEATAAKAFLKQRKSEIETLIMANRVEFTSISQWSLVQ